MKVGDRIGRLIISKLAGRKTFPHSKSQRLWLCKCDCGNEVKVINANLKPGHSTSCGCVQRENRFKAKKHGHAKRGVRSKIYWVWANMLQRCHDPKSTSWKYYGARGIRVEWKSFSDFLRDMGPMLEKRQRETNEKLTIERKNNDGNYSKENCCWATYHEQRLNCRPKGTA